MECLLCTRATIPFDKILSHVRSDLGYRPESCGTCAYRTYDENELMMHIVEEGHTAGEKYRNVYLDHLVQKIATDTFEASEVGRSVYLKQLSGPAGNSVSKKRKLPTDRNDDEQDEDERWKMSRIVDFPIMPSVQQHQLVKTPDSAELRSRGRCMLCKEDVSLGFLERRAHVLDNHIAGPCRVENMDARQLMDLRTAMKRAWGGGRSNTEMQCAQCQASFGNESSRARHVGDQHFEIMMGYEKCLHCPFDKCAYYNGAWRKVHQHLLAEHGYSSHGALPHDIKKNFLPAKFRYEADLAELVDHLFPSPILLPRPPNNACIDRPALDEATKTALLPSARMRRSMKRKAMKETAKIGRKATREAAKMKKKMKREAA